MLEYVERHYLDVVGRGVESVQCVVVVVLSHPAAQWTKSVEQHAGGLLHRPVSKEAVGICVTALP
jgi:hypothetical protein